MPPFDNSTCSIARIFKLYPNIIFAENINYNFAKNIIKSD